MTNPLSPYFRGFGVAPRYRTARWVAVHKDGSVTELNKKTPGGYEYAPGKFATPLSYARERAIEEGATLERRGYRK